MMQSRGVNVGASSSGGGAASSIVIGNPVTGGGADRVLYEDGSQNLAAASNFTFASNILTAPTITATTAFQIGSSPQYNIISDAGIAFRSGGTYLGVLSSVSKLILPTTGEFAFGVPASQTRDVIISRKAAGIVSFDSTTSANGQAALHLSERTAPSAPAANGVYIYTQDDGSGKTQLMALFSSGAAQQIAIQP